MGKDAERGFGWAGLPVIATAVRLPRPYATEPRTVTPDRRGSRSRGVARGRLHGRLTRASGPGKLFSEPVAVPGTPWYNAP
jgi:hypothetical protein